MTESVSIYRRRVWYARHVPDWGTCPCCGYPVSERGDHGICLVCGWEDDGEGEAELDLDGGPNHISLREARRNFEAWGHCDGPDLPAGSYLPACASDDKPRLGKKRLAVDCFDAIRRATSEGQARELFCQALYLLEIYDDSASGSERERAARVDREELMGFVPNVYLQ